VSAPAPPFTAALLSAAALLPAAAAVALASGGRRGRAALPGLIPWTALPALAAGWLLPDGAAAAFPWTLLGARLGLDPTGRLFLGFTALLWLVAGLFGRGHLAADGRRARFFFFFGLSMSGNLGLILAQEMIGFYVFFALMSFAAYGLVVHAGDPAALRAGRIYMILVVAGEVVLFAAFALLAWESGGVALRGAGAGPYGRTAAGLFFIGFAIKAGALPLHVWLPLAHPAAPTPASAVLSGAMIKAGLIGWLRFLPVGEPAAPEGWGPAVVLIGLAGAFYGVAAGGAQSNPKTILAYSSISQMGLMTAGVGAALFDPPAAAAALPAVGFYALHHGLAKGALFLGVGLIGHAAGRRARAAAWAGMLFGALSLAGAPLTSGAAAKASLKGATALLPAAWAGALAGLLPLAAFGTALLMGRLLAALAARSPAGGRPDPWRWGPWLILLAGVGAAGLGLPAPPGIPARPLGDPAGIAADLWPVAAGAAAVAILRRLSRRRGRLALPAIPEGDLVAVYAAAGRALARGLRLAGGLLRPRRAAAGRRVPPPGASPGWWIARIETALADWPGAGLLFLLLIGAFLTAALWPRGASP
jgi:formate hydrogenlyase subunit 3/multisubunit Na+/H+ antiporter MnhD subunit